MMHSNSVSEIVTEEHVHNEQVVSVRHQYCRCCAAVLLWCVSVALEHASKLMQRNQHAAVHVLHACMRQRSNYYTLHEVVSISDMKAVVVQQQ
jgi:hypothetical protein